MKKLRTLEEVIAGVLMLALIFLGISLLTLFDVFDIIGPHNHMAYRKITHSLMRIGVMAGLSGAFFTAISSVAAIIMYFVHRVFSWKYLVLNIVLSTGFFMLLLFIGGSM